MVSDGIVSALQLAHVCVNSALFLALLFQGSMGWRIRGRRVKGAAQDFSVIKRHRALGPVLAALLPIGYLAGLVTAYLNRGLLARHPGHLAGGTVLLAVALAAVLASKRILGVDSPWRSAHFALGMLLLFAFLVQIYLGLNIFL